ncbi:DUF6020 family protein [Gryllotalpicola sp.]|uniref:DUF6020 family protein n=1 Tax=Gryllotalpicola sp. TaxID=1932787 RepID=UPI002632121F|nr:DUF6020 family protein [Gryllotalpicola sp.]
MPAQLRRFAVPVDWSAAALAVLLGLFIVIGASFDATDSPAWFASSAGAALGSALVVLGLGLVFYVAIKLVFDWLARRSDARPAAKITSMRTALRRSLLPTSGVLFAGWMPWLLIHFPGNVDSDTITQLFQWLGLAVRSDHHPWFDTMVFGWFWNLGHAFGDYNIGLFVFLVLQEAATALGMGLALVYLGRLGLPRRWRWTLTVLAAVFPVFAIAVSVMSKDSFAGVFWMPFLVLFVEAIRTRGQVLMRPWIGASALAIVIPLVLAKRTNIYLVVVCLIVLLVLAARPARLRILGGGVVAVLVTSVLWPLAILPAAGVQAATNTDILSIPLQQTARTVLEHGSSLPATEKQAIDAVLRYDGLAQAYVPRRSDSVKSRWNSHATTSQRLAYAVVWLDELVRYPSTYFAATADNTFPYFAPVTPIAFQESLTLNRYIDVWLSWSIPGTTREQIAQVALSLHQPAALAPLRTAVDRAAAVFNKNPFSSAAWYCSWIPLLALAYAIRRRSGLLALATIPLFLNLGFLVAGPIALSRYMIPSIYGSVLIVGLMTLRIPLSRRPGGTASGSRGSS